MATLSGIKRTVAQSVGSGIGIYATKEDLPTSNLVVGEQAYVTASSRFYVSNGSGWYNVALVNATPTLSIDPTGTITLSNTGEATTITLTATDSDNSVAGLTYTVESDGNFSGLATISQDSSVFTITPLGEDSATTTSSTLTFKASDGINFGSGSRSLSLTFRSENSNYNALLLKAEGNGGTNTSITDASSNSHTVTLNGSSHATSFSPYRHGGYSYYFDGSGDYLVPAITTAVGTSDFTLEGWFYPTNTSSDTTIFDFRSSGNWGIFSILANNTVGYYNGSSSVGITTNTATDNEWNHIAIVRDSGSVKIYINGILGSTTSDTTSWTIASSPRIGGNKGNTAYMNGYITDVRFVSGTAVYTSNFTPPTDRLTAVTNTKLLTCHLPHLIDGSTDANSITITGNVSSEPFAPYDYASYSTNSNGGSIASITSSDYIKFDSGYITSNTTWWNSSGFTLETWVYLTDTTASSLFDNRPSGSAGLFIDYGNQAAKRFAIYANSNWRGTFTTTIEKNIWHHLAFVFSGTSANLYVNGVLDATTVTVPDTASYAYFGQSQNTLGAVQYTPRGNTVLEGYYSDFRLTAGSTYTTGFTPPTEPVSSSGSILHVKGTDANVYDASQTSGRVSLYGDAASSTSQTKYASSSVYFDGSGDYAIVDFPALGTDDFTWEFWLNPSTINSNYRALTDPRTSNTNNPLIWIRNTNVIYYYAGADRIIGTTTLSAGTWYHVALVRNNGTSKLYLNGTQEGSDYADTGNYTADILYIGQRYTSTANNYHGYLEDMRITKGLSRYPFTPAKETVTAISGTDLLVAHAATLIDGSSAGRTLTAGGNAAVSSFAPKGGMYSIAFDGTNDYVSVPTSSLGGTGDFTLEYWIYMNSTSNFGIIGDINGNGIGGWATWWNSSAGEFRIGNNDLANYEGYAFTNTTGKWYHHAWVRDGSTLSFFIDGTKIARTTNVGNMGTSDLDDQTSRIGLFNDDLYDFNGYISNLRIIEGTALYSDSFTPPTSELTG